MARKAKNPIEMGKEADELIVKNSGNVENTEVTPDGDDNIDLPPVDSALEDDSGLSVLDAELDNDLHNASDDTPRDQGADYKHMYEVLQGKYNTELGRMATEVSNLTKQNQQLFLELSNLKGGAQQDGSDGNLNEDLKLLKEQYPAIYKGVMAVLKSESGNMVRGTEAKVDNVIQRTLAVDRQRYLDRLTEKIPRWEAINTHPIFVKWLGIKDKYTGVARAVLLRSAYDRMDADTTITFFEDFMQEKGIKNQGKASQSSGEIAPNTSGTGSVGKKQGGQNYITRTEINNFYKERTMGSWRGTPEEAAKMEQKIFNAIKEGHVLEK